MAAEIIDGKAIAAEVRAEVEERLRRTASAFGEAPGLATVLVGDDPASQIYVAGKHRACEEVGMRSIGHELPADAPRSELIELVEELNADDAGERHASCSCRSRLRSTRRSVIARDRPAQGRRRAHPHERRPPRAGARRRWCRRTPVGRDGAAAACRRRARGRRGGRRRPQRPRRQADGLAAARRERDRDDLPFAHARPRRGVPPRQTCWSPPSAAAAWSRATW